MRYFVIAVFFEDGTRYYFNQRTTVQNTNLAHRFPNEDLARKSFQNSLFKNVPHKLISRRF